MEEINMANTNKLDNSEIEQKSKRTEAHRRADRVYAEKHKPVFIAISYKTDKEVGDKLKQYLSDTGQSANSYIKDLIAKDLKKKGVI